jgi:CopG family nickel-responsive transcriptional regulator
MSKRDELVRFGVAMEGSLLRPFDALVKQRGSTRSELLRDLARAEVTRDQIASGTDAVATVTIVYDHHVRALTETLNELQHSLGGRVRSTMHVHLDQSYCLEVIILQGPAAELRKFADRVFATRGVKHGGIDMIAAGKNAQNGLHVHLHAHDHQGGHVHTHHEHSPHEHGSADHEHAHDHEHGHQHGHSHAPPTDRAKLETTPTGQKTPVRRPTKRA